MEEYKVTGMSCAACSARVEKAILQLDGVESCSVNLLTNSMQVEGTVTESAIISAVSKAGYGAFKKGSEKKEEKNENIDNETKIISKRLIYSSLFLILLMYVSMGHAMWGFPLPAFFVGNYIAIGILQMLLAIIIMVLNRKFFISGFKSLIRKSPNMDTLVALGSGASFVYSTYILFLMTGVQLNGDFSSVMHLGHEFYFESAAMILALITFGKMLESHSKGKTTNALKSLMDLSPKHATVIKDGSEVNVPVEDVLKGTIFVVRPGESIPVDGVIVEGTSAVDESALSGESVPVDKLPDDKVWAATINQSGFLKCKATNVGEDTTFSQIIQMVKDASASKAPIAKIADKVSGIFVPVVILISLITIAAWLLLGESVGFSLARGISVLVISCPCALGLATPVAIMVGNGVGAKNGILFKNATSLEQAGKINIVALDKTGTITIGKPKITDIIPAENISEAELISLAFSLEAKSEHPLAKAIIEKAAELGISAHEVSDFSIFPGNGLSGKIGADTLIGGNIKFIEAKTTLSENDKDICKKLAIEGKTPLLFSKNDNLIGIIAVADVIKGESPDAINELKKMGIRVVMLTGDNEITAKAIASRAGIDEVISGVMPEEKEKVIINLQKEGKVCMVGDGINDAPALTRADIGIAIGAGTDIAIDAADIVLVKSILSDVPAAIRLSKATLKNIHQNLFWAFFYNIIGIPLAAGVWIPIFGWTLNPMFGAAAMSLSSFCVVSNALRLNMIKIKKTKKEKEKMEKVLKIEGMMCPHCEARVKKVLEELDGVSEAVASHKDGTATVILSADVSDELLKTTVENQGYKVL